jgi:hypothetical protein
MMMGGSFSMLVILIETGKSGLAEESFPDFLTTFV